MRTILVPLDGSALAEQALPYARTLAQLLGARVRLLTVIVEYQNESLMAEGIVGMTEVVEIEMTEDQPFRAFGQPGGEQGVEALAIGDAGQRVLFGEAVQAAL